MSSTADDITAFFDGLWSGVQGVWEGFIDYETLQTQSDLAQATQSNQSAVDFETAQANARNRQITTYVLIGGAALAAFIALRR